MIFNTLAGKILRDGEAHIRTLSQSSLDWTVVRSPVMNDKASMAYKLNETYPWPWQTVNRQLVAQAMVAQVTSSQYVRKAPYLHRVR